MEKVSKMREAIIAVAGGNYFPTKQRLWEAAARKSKVISYRTIRSLWDGTLKNEDHWAKREIQRLADEVDARKELAAFAEQTKKAIGGMRATDENFFSSEIDRLERLLDRIGAVDSA